MIGAENRASVRLGTRASRLALAQSSMLRELLLVELGETVELVSVKTEGDASTIPIEEMGDTGVFVNALRDALLGGEIDVAVHSYKDLPTTPVPGLTVAAVPMREDPRDVLVARDGHTLASLPPGARVGTGSPRRAAQLRALDLPIVVVPIRGNVDTRLRMVAKGDLEAVLVARAGLARLGQLGLVTQELSPDLILPAPGQGALAVECRADDRKLTAALGRIDHFESRMAVLAERSLMAALEAGCSAPVGAHAVILPAADGADRMMSLEGVVAAVDGSTCVRLAATGAVNLPLGLGLRLARTFLRAGAATLLPGPARPGGLRPQRSMDANA
jgi:hydroxymethylbilane synthase